MALFSVRGKSPLESLTRLLALFLVAGLVGLAFWKNGERNMERIAARGALYDPAGQLSESERERAQAFIAAMKADWGIEARIRIEAGAAEPAQEARPDAKTLAITLRPAEKSARVLLPPLLARALGPDFAPNLEREHFPFHYADGRRWQKGLVSALDLMESRLAAIKNTQTPAPGATDAKEAK